MSNIEKQAVTPEGVPTQQVLTPKQNLENIEAVRDLFARAHDLIAQASHPGHMGAKVAEVMNFLAFHYSDFKSRAEGLAKQIENDATAELSKVNVDEARAAVDAVLVQPETPKP
jgi:hypothetical protein